MKDEWDQTRSSTCEIFYESQGTNLLCGLHAVNNLIGREKYKKEDLDEIAIELKKTSGITHKHCCCDGDFDANVLLVSLQRIDYSTQWLDNRKSYTISSLQTARQDDQELVGFLINIPN